MGAAQTPANQGQGGAGVVARGGVWPQLSFFMGPRLLISSLKVKKYAVLKDKYSLSW